MELDQWLEDPVREELGRAVGSIPSGLFVLTSSVGERREGLLASWVMQASLEPLHVTVAIKKLRPLRLLLEASRAFVVNVMGEEDEALMESFRRPPAPGEDPFADLEVEPCEQAGESPILHGGLAWLGCRLAGTLDAGDHVLYLGEVVAGGMPRPGRPRVHLRESGFDY